MEFPSIFYRKRFVSRAASVAPEVREGSFPTPAADVFFFGTIILEVRLTCPTTCTVGGGGGRII